MKVVVVQKGSRERHLAARALHRRGMLARLVTDFYPPFGGLGARWLRDHGWGRCLEPSAGPARSYRGR